MTGRINRLKLSSTIRIGFSGCYRGGKAKSLRSVDLARHCEIDERRLRILIRELIADGFLIASTTGGNPGFFIAENWEEVKEYAQGLRDRLIADATRRRDFLRASRQLIGQLQMPL